MSQLSMAPPILQEVLKESIRKLCHSFCVDSTMMYDTLFEVPNALETVQSEDWDYDRDSYRPALFKRLYTISARLTTSLDTTPSGLSIGTPRIYDDLMVEEMKKLYAKMIPHLYDGTELESSLLDYLPSIKEIPFEKVLLLATEFESVERVDRAENYTIIELAFYCCLLGSIHRRSVNTLNRPLGDRYDQRRAKKRFSDFASCLFSDSLRRALTKSIYDKVHMELYDKTNLSQKETSLLFLQERNLSLYILALAELFSLTDVSADQLLSKATTKLSQERLNTLYMSFKGELHETLIRDSGWSCLPAEDVMIADHIFQIVSSFVDNILKATSNLLLSLPEASLAGTQPIYEFLQQIINKK